jgi:hypothetical protein
MTTVSKIMCDLCGKVIADPKNNLMSDLTGDYHKKKCWEKKKEFLKEWTKQSKR